MINPPQGGSLYAEIAAQLRAAIRDGRYRPGQILPSERTLQEQFNVARETVRHAIAVLRAEGLLVVRRGHGVFVREPIDLEDYTLPPGSAVTARTSTAEERGAYDMADGAPVFVITTREGVERVLPADQYRLRRPS